MAPTAQRRTNASAGLLPDKKERARTFTKRIPSLISKCSMLSKLTGARIVIMIHGKGEEKRPASFVWYASKCKGNNFMKQCDKMAERACRPDTKIQGCTNADFDEVFHKPAGGKWTNIDRLPTSCTLTAGRNAALKRLLDERRPVDLPALTAFSGGFYHPALENRREAHEMLSLVPIPCTSDDDARETVLDAHDTSLDAHDATTLPASKAHHGREYYDYDYARSYPYVRVLTAHSWASAGPMTNVYDKRKHLWHTLETRLWRT